MLMSMTGHGDARHQTEGRTASVEIRTVNSRYFKLAIRGPESYARLEALIEGLIRKHIRRGTINVTLRMTRDVSGDDYRINPDVLQSYMAQVEKISPDAQPGLGTYLQMPGVIDELADGDNQLEEDWAVVQPAVGAALKMLQDMRQAEGEAMAKDLAENCRAIDSQLAKIESKSPQIVEGFRVRLTDRLNKILAEHDVAVDATDVIREVGIYAERCDISEEIVRLRCHLEQFEIIASEQDSAGRKLEFLIQEMVRETNTIGSKCNDASVALHVVEIKTLIERMREMIQNVE